MKLYRNGLLAATILASFGLTSANAADFTDPPPDWTGFYFGGQVGFGMQSVTEFYPNDAGGDPGYRQHLGGHGPVGGLFAGYNWQPSPDFVVGVEAEANISGIQGKWYDFKNDEEWSAAARLRAGYLLTPRTMFYGSVGLAYSEWNSDYIESWDDGDYDPFGLQLAVGMEALTHGPFSVRVEAVYTMYAEETFSTGVPTSDLETEAETLVARIGAAYHLGGAQETMANGSDVGAFEWTGFYIGGQAGLGMQSFEESYESGPSASYTQDLDGQGFVGGLFAGYNWHIAPAFVVGAEVEGNYSGVSGEWYGKDADHDWFWAARLRAGYLVTPETLLYGSVGWARGEFDVQDVFDANGGGSFDGKFALDGLQLGVGLEAMVSENVSVRVEGIHTIYEEQHVGDVFGGGNDQDLNFTTLVGRVGAAIHF